MNRWIILIFAEVVDIYVIYLNHEFRNDRTTGSTLNKYKTESGFIEIRTGSVTVINLYFNIEPLDHSQILECYRYRCYLSVN